MAITTDILESYRRPRAVLRRHLADGGSEARALAVLMGACLLMFVAQLPGLARAAHLEPEVPLDARMGGALMAMVFMVPLIAYAVAAASHGVARLFGGKGTFLSARMALFWSMLAISPLMLFHGLVRGMIGPGPGLTLTGLGVLAVFLLLSAEVPDRNRARLMDLTLPNILALVRLTVQDPRQGARRIMALDLPINGRWLALILVAAGSAIGTHLSIALMPPEQREIMLTLIASPLRTALLQAGIWAAIAAAIAAGGQVGGTGTFPDALILMAWLQFILLGVQMVQVLAGLVLPVLADLIGLAGLGLLLWLLTNFVAELHGFRSLAAVFAGIIVGAFGLIFVAALLLTLILGGPVAGVYDDV